MAIHEQVNAETFQKVVLAQPADDKNLILVDFKAEWCGPCKLLGPILHKIAADESQEVTLVTVDVDAEPALAQAFQITAMPTVIAFKAGKPIKQFRGLLPEPKVKEFITDTKAA